MSKIILIQQLNLTVLFQTIQSSAETVLFQKVQFRICTQFRCPWCNGYRRRKWTLRHEFKSWTRLIEFHIALLPWETYESNCSPPAMGK